MEIERSIIKNYRNQIYKKFCRAIDQYGLIEENDKIMVCISGGKDSFLLAKCMEEFQKHGPISFEACYVCMDPGYAKKNRECIEENANKLCIDLEIMDSDVFDVMEKTKNSCSLCARMRRGFLYKVALQKGCNKIALGHHFDDVIETTLLSMFYGSEIKTMIPKRKSSSHTSIEVIRPLYLVKEQDILKWVYHNSLSFINCACAITQRKEGSKRKEVKEWIRTLKLADKKIDERIFISMHNVNLDSVVGITKDKKKIEFKELYQKKEFK